MISLPRQRLRHLAAFLLAAALVRPVLQARDVFVVFSGGGSPLSNNYSQYVQAKNLSEFFRSRYSSDSVWVFFGAGNQPGQPPKLADAYKKLKRTDASGQEILIDSWLPGYIPDNHPATKESFLGTLKSEILPAVHDGGTLFLFIGDHGEQSRTAPWESQATMWQMKPSASDHGWTQDMTEELTLATLRSELAAGIGKGRVVFCMTQCHSGGFNYLGVQRVPNVPGDWFTAATSLPSAQPLGLAAAGFTATDETSLAAGCDPDPDPDKWAGYERFIPEKLLGLDLLSGERLDDGQPSFAAANTAATLVDRTIDKPRSTSEQYLETWATLIDSHLLTDPTLKPAIRDQLAVYLRVRDGGYPSNVTDPLFLKYWSRYQRFAEELENQNPGTVSLIIKGSAKELDEAIGFQPEPAFPVAPAGGGPRGGRFGAMGGSPENLKLWTDTIRPAWKAAIESGKVPHMDPEAVAFEKTILTAEEKGTDLTVNPRAILNFEFWHSGFAHPESTDEGKAEAATLWAAQRRTRILDWAKASSNDAVRTAAGKWRRRPEGFGFGGGGRGRDTSGVNKIALERVRFYRRELGAWAFLLSVGDREALEQLAFWQNLEATPLPAPTLAAN